MRRATITSLLLVAVLFAACGSGAGSPSGDAPTGSASPAPVESVAPASPDSTIATPKPTKSPAPAKSPAPTPAASGTPVDASAQPSADASPTSAASAGVADACQPQGSNPSFWPGIATAVSWDVYCAVLPSGWFVQSGSYRQANGGKLVISYKGPGGASLSLSEGSFCTDGTGCVPSGTDSGDAQFGSMAGTLVTLDGGGYAIVVARGQQPSWLMVTQGLDQATTTSLGAALARVSG
jgi:hypothetical protein